MSGQARSHVGIMSAAKHALLWYEDHPESDYSTSATRRTALDAAAAIVDQLENDRLFRDYEAEVFRINETGMNIGRRLEPGALLLEDYTNGVRCGSIAGRLRCSMNDARTLIEHIPTNMANGIVKKYFPS